MFHFYKLEKKFFIIPVTNSANKIFMIKKYTFVNLTTNTFLKIFLNNKKSTILLLHILQNKIKEVSLLWLDKNMLK